MEFFFGSCIYIYIHFEVEILFANIYSHLLASTLNFPHNLELCSCLHVSKQKHLQHLCFPWQNCSWSLDICYTNVLFSLIISFAKCMCLLGILLYDWNKEIMSLETIQHLNSLWDMLNILLVLKPRCDELPKSWKGFLSTEEMWKLH